jgi:hypothetical protein
MTYMLITQNGLMMPDCFCRSRFQVSDGSLTIWKINSKGRVMEACEGTIFNGKFKEE